MRNDSLKLLNTKFLEAIPAMSDDELWNFLLENLERIKECLSEGNHPASGFFYGYNHGGNRNEGDIDWMKTLFLRQLEEYRDGVIFSIVKDFCFSDQTVAVEYWAQGGFLDHPDSCSVKISDDIMPPVDEESDVGYEKEYFHLLEPHHLEHIIQAMEKNFDKLTLNTRDDITKIKAMKQQCLADHYFKVAYIYSRVYR